MIGEKIIKLRKEKGLRVEDIAVRTGLATRTIARIEAGQNNVNLTTLDKIAQVLDVSLASLLEKEGK